MATNQKRNEVAAFLMRGVGLALAVPTLLIIGAANAWANNWVNPSVTISHVNDGSCIAGPFANASSTSVSINWTALNTDAAPGRSIILSGWRVSGGFVGVEVFNNAAVGQLPTQTTVDDVATSHLTGNVMYFGLYDSWDSGSVWSQTRSPTLSPDLTAPATGVSGYSAIDMTTDPDCVATPEINVTGNGINISDGDSFASSSDHTNFGTIAHVSGTVSRTFAIQNTGTGTLTLGANAASLSGTHAADFTVTSQPATTVAASGSTSVTVRFDPSAVGTRNATLSIANNDADENPYNFAISGTGANSPEMNVTGNGQNIADGDTTPQAADHTDFGSIDIGNGDIERIFTVQNMGDANLTLGSSAVSITGPDAADFSVFTHPFSIIGDGSSSTFRIRFDPSTAGAKSATLTIANDDADESPYNFAIAGTATTAPEIEVRRDNNGLIENGADHIANRVASLSFNEASGTRTYTINNIGSDTLTISNVTITGTHAAEFSVVTPPAGTVVAGGSTSITLRFTQTTAGTRTANLNITNDDADEGAFSFVISGHRFSGPDLDMSGNGLDISNGDSTPRPEDDTDFGSVDAASGFIEKSFTGLNNGDSPIAISSITVTGSHASDFTVTTGTGFAPLTVRFDPSAVGVRTATVNIASDALVDNPFTFAIQGTGTSAAPEIGVSSSEGGAVTDGGTDAQGSEAAGSAKTVTYTVSNTGTDDLTLATATSSALTNVTVNAISTPAATTVTPGNATTFTVQYTPTLAGAFSFDLAFTNNDGDENPYNMTVSGTGTGVPEIAVSSSESGAVADSGTDAQGSEAAGSAKTVTYTVSNTGTDNLTLATATSSALTNVTVNSISAPAANTVLPGNATTFTVQYTPTLAGPFSFGLAFTNSDGDENPYNVTVSGTGTGVPEIAVSSSESGAVADGGADAQGNEPAGTAKTITYTVSNTGTDSLTLATATSSALSNVTVNLISAPAATTVTAGNATTFTVQYTPTLAGAFSFDLAFTNNDGDENPYNMTVSGTGAGAPEMNLLAGAVSIADNPSFDPSSLAATRLDETVGGSSSQLFTIENTGTGTLTLGANAVALSGVGVGDFSVSQQPATSVAPGGTTTFRIAFAPTVSGLQGPIDVAINNDDADENPYNFRIQGTGRAIEINVTGNGQNIADNPAHAPTATDHTDFGNADVATGIVTRTFTIENNGFGLFLDMGANSVSLSGAHAGDFSVTAQPASSVDVGLTTTFQISFNPSATGIRGPVDVSIANDDPDEGPYNFRVQGSGTVAPEINVTGNGQNISAGDVSAAVGDHTDFGSADITSGTVSRTFTIENSGSGVLTLGANAASLSGANAGDFSVTVQPAASVAASGSASITVQFDPSALGARNATLSIANDDADEGPYTFALAGMGAGAPEISLSSSESGAVADGGADAQGSEAAGASKTVTYTITNSGTEALTLAQATTSSLNNVAVNSVSAPGSTTVASGGGTTTFTVQYTPTLAGAFSFDLTLTNNDGDESPYNFTVSGTGTGVPEIAVLSNGVEIVDGDTTPAAADNTDFGGADVTSGTVSRTFAIQNTGTDVLTLGANAASISGVNASDFSVAVQPATSVAPGGSTSVTVQFDPAGLGLRTATLTIANDDADENPYDIALSGEGISGGTITIVQNITGPDVPVGFSSATPALNFTLTSVSGTAQTSLPGVPAGAHALVTEDLTPIGYGVSSIACNDADSTGNVVSRMATINLVSGEHVTCVFEIVDTRGPTSQMIADYLGARSTLLLSHQPGNDRRIDRLKDGTGVSGGDSFRAFGHGLRSPLPVDLAIDENRFSFATSLKRVQASGGQTSLAANDNSEEASPLDIWIEGSASRFIDGTSGGGSFGLLSLGVDYLVEPDILIGFMGQIDRFKQDFTTPGSEINGRGWMAGPYATLKLDDHLFLDVLGIWGRSDNDISPFGTYTDTFETERWLVNSTLTGEFQAGMWDLRPSYTLQFFHERQFAYTDSLGVRIPEQSLSQGDMRLGPQIQYTHAFEDGSLLRPKGGFEGVYSFGERDTFSVGSFAAETQGLTGQVNGGLDYQSTDGLLLGLSADYGGIGGTAKSFGLAVHLSMPLN